jgi:hypothetical protein
MFPSPFILNVIPLAQICTFFVYDVQCLSSFQYFHGLNLSRDLDNISENVTSAAEKHSDP